MPHGVDARGPPLLVPLLRSAHAVEDALEGPSPICDVADEMADADVDRRYRLAVAHKTAGPELSDLLDHVLLRRRIAADREVEQEDRAVVAGLELQGGESVQGVLDGLVAVDVDLDRPARFPERLQVGDDLRRVEVRFSPARGATETALAIGIDQGPGAPLVG